MSVPATDSNRSRGILQKGKSFLKSNLSRMSGGIDNPESLPSTSQTVNRLHSVRSGDTFKQVESTVSTDSGKKVVKDVEKLISDTEVLLQHKNEGDDLQKAIYHLNRGTNLMDRQSLRASGASSEVTGQLKVSVSQFFDLVKMLVSQSEFRNALMDLLKVFMSIFGYNFGDNWKLPEREHMQQSRQSLSHVTQDFLQGDRSLRDTLHGYVDTVADTTEDLVPTSVQERGLDQFRGHARRISAGDATAYEESRRAMREGLHSARQKKESFEIPEEHRQQAVDTLKSALRTIRSKSEYQSAVENLLSQFDQLVQTGNTYSSNLKDKGKRAVSENDAESEFRQAYEHLKNVLSRFANGKSVDGVTESIRSVAWDIRNDEKLAMVFADWKRFLDSSLRDPDFIEKDTYVEDAKILSQYTRETVVDSHKNSVHDMFGSITDFFGGFAQDPDNQQVAADVKTLIHDIFFDESGNITIKPDLARDMAAILPILAEKIAKVPIPVMEYEDEKFYFKAEDVVLQCSGLIPKYVRLNTGAVMDMEQHLVKGNISIELSKIQISTANAKFSYRKKSGFFHIEDTGLLDFDIFRNGVNVRLNLSPYYRNGVKGFDVDECSVRIDALDLRVHDTKNHNLLYKLARRPVRKIAKKQLGKVMTDHLRKALQVGSGQSVTI